MDKKEKKKSVNLSNNDNLLLETPTGGIFTITKIVGRQLEKTVQYYAKIQLGDKMVRTDSSKFNKTVIWCPSFSVDCHESDKLKIQVYQSPSSDEKKGKLVGSAVVEIHLFFKDAQLRLKMKSKLFPTSTLHLYTKFESSLSTLQATSSPNSNSSSSSSSLLSPISASLSFRKLSVIKSKPSPNHPPSPIITLKHYSSLLSVLSENEFEIVKGICQTTSFSDVDDISLCFVTTFYHQQKILDLLKYAIRQELKNTENEEILFRGQSVYIKMMSDFASLSGKNYLQSQLKPIIVSMSSCKLSFEVNPSREENGVEENRERIKTFALQFLQTICSSSHLIPAPIREVSRYLSRCVKKRYPNSVNAVIGGFLFLRFICPAIVAPEQSLHLDPPPNMISRRGLVLCAKLLQNLASGVKFGEKESYMEDFNPFITEHLPNMHQFFSAVIKKSNSELTDEVEIRDEDVTRHLIRLHHYLNDHLAGLENVVSPPLYSQLTTIMNDLGTPPPIDLIDSPRSSELHRNRSTFFTRFQSIFRS